MGVRLVYWARVSFDCVIFFVSVAMVIRQRWKPTAVGRRDRTDS